MAHLTASVRDCESRVPIKPRTCRGRVLHHSFSRPLLGLADRSVVGPSAAAHLLPVDCQTVSRLIDSRAQRTLLGWEAFDDGLNLR